MVFLRFSTEFTRFSNSQILLKLQLFTKAPRTFQSFIDMPSVYTKLPKKEGDAIGSPSHGSGSSGQNPAAPAAGSAGGGGEDD
jgi:hypothetical protein